MRISNEEWLIRKNRKGFHSEVFLPISKDVKFAPDNGTIASRHFPPKPFGSLRGFTPERLPAILFSVKKNIGIPSSRQSSPEKGEMSFWEHLEELRLTLFACLLSFIAAAGVSLFFYKEIFEILRFPLECAAKDAGATELFPNPLTSMHFTDPFSILLYIALLGGIVISGPFVLYKLSKFVAPALTARERARLIPICISASLLFVAGALAAFFKLAPASIRFMYFFSEEMGLQVNWLAADYYAFIVILVLFVGAVFEFPLFIVALQYFEIVSKKTLLRQWRWVIAGLLIAIAFVSPIGDPVSLLALTGVLFLLFLCAVFVGDFLLSKKLKARADETAAFEAEFSPAKKNTPPAIDGEEEGDLKILDP